MALGGGKFTAMDKSLPGAYINSISAARSMSIVGDNGIVAIAIEHDFGNTGELIELKPSDFKEDSLIHLGYNLFDDKLKGLRELFENSKLVYLYILNNTTKATNDFATAKKGGARGNDITIKIQPNIEETSKKDVITLLDGIIIDRQTVKSASELVDNQIVEFKKEAQLTDTAGTTLKTGANGVATVADHTTFLSKIETLNFNALGCMGTTKDIQKVYVAFTKRLRDEVGLKFGTIMAEATDLSGENIYDYEGVVVIKNQIKGTGKKGNELVPFTTAIYSSVELGKSNLNRQYTGEYEINTDYTQSQLKALTKSGRFVYHKVGDTVRVLEDVNSLVTINDEKREEFKDNQVIRTIDALALADAKAFNELYLGKVNIDKAGLESYENKVIEIRDYFLNNRALEDYDKASVKVERVEGIRGAIKVDCIVTPPQCFRQLYLTNYVR